MASMAAVCTLSPGESPFLDPAVAGRSTVGADQSSTTPERNSTMNDTTAFAWDELPEIVANYLRAHIVQDFATAMTHLPEHVTVIDNGEVLHGREETFKVFEKSAHDYRVETTLNGISRPSDDVWEVDTHLSGNFPGGEVGLRMIFTVVEDVIRRLEITVRPRVSSISSHRATT
jgi:hypothetical protein